MDRLTDRDAPKARTDAGAAVRGRVVCGSTRARSRRPAVRLDRCCQLAAVERWFRYRSAGAHFRVAAMEWQPPLMRWWLGPLLVGLALPACSGEEDAVTKRGAGVAIEGSLQTEFVVHLYRFTGDVVVQLHPSVGPVTVEVLRPNIADDMLEWCPVEVGFQDQSRERIGDCVKLRQGKAVLDVGTSGSTHIAISLVGDVAIEEATVTYVPADNFLAVDLP